MVPADRVPPSADIEKVPLSGVNRRERQEKRTPELSRGARTCLLRSIVERYVSTKSLRTRYCAAQPFANFVRDANENVELWQVLARRAQVPHDAVARVSALGGRWHLLVLAEDWCGDALNSLPVLARLAELAPNLDLRVLARDTHPDLMDAHLSPSGARAIPVVIVLDADWNERGWWGSRPAALQQWVNEEGRTMSKEDRYREIRRWYARDRGAEVLDEVITLLESAASQRLVA